MPDEERERLMDSPAWAVVYSSLDNESASLGIRSCCKLFYVEVPVEKLEGWPGKANFIQLLQEAVNDDLDAEDALWCLIWEQVLSFIDPNETGEKQQVTSLSLQQFYSVSITALEFDGQAKNSWFVPLAESFVPIDQLRPQMKLKEIDGADQLLHVDGSRLRIRPCYPQHSDITSDTPAIVSLDDSATLYHFKAVQHSPSLLRELDILQRLTKHHLHEKWRLPVLHGIVTYSNNPDTMMGMLLQYIDHDDNMLNWVAHHNPSQRLRQKWYDQILNTVSALHECGIVWGDVKPDNVLIDHAQNAWVIDFGGGFNPDYVDRDVMETVEGDNQGVSRLREFLLDG